MTDKEAVKNIGLVVSLVLFTIGCFLGMGLLFWGSNYWHSEPDIPQRLGDLNLGIAMLGFFVGSAVARYISKD